MISLEQLRKNRNFDTYTCYKQKCILINKFFKDNNLDSAVVGISGGIDSALVLGLLCRASTHDNSPIKKIVAITLPIYSKGSTEQDDTIYKANLLFNKFEYNVTTMNVDLSDTCQSYVKAFGIWNTSFSEGQLLSVVRTPALYYQAALLQDSGYRSIVVGTTNRDEGAYIGFFGKASDGMNDLQPIADLHKSEVIKLAKYIGVPEEIINATPKGNVHDGKSDVEMIGASYDDIEFFILLKDKLNSTYNNNTAHIDIDLSIKTFESFHNITSLHEKNSHKYETINGYLTPMGYSKYVDVYKRLIKL